MNKELATGLPQMETFLEYSKYCIFRAVASSEDITTKDLYGGIKLPVGPKTPQQLYWESKALKADELIDDLYKAYELMAKNALKGFPITPSGAPFVHYHLRDIPEIPEALKKEITELWNSKKDDKDSEELYDLYISLTHNKYKTKGEMRRELAEVVSRYEAERKRKNQERIQNDLDKKYNFGRETIKLDELVSGEALLDNKKTSWANGDDFNLLLLTGKDKIDEVDPEDYMKLKVAWLRVVGRESDAIDEVKKFFTTDDDKWTDLRSVIYINSVFRVNAHAELRQLVKNILSYKQESTGNYKDGIKNAKGLLKAYSKTVKKVVKKVEEEVDGKVETKKVETFVDTCWDENKLDNFIDACVGMLMKEGVLEKPKDDTPEDRKKTVEENKGKTSGVKNTDKVKVAASTGKNTGTKGATKKKQEEKPKDDAAKEEKAKDKLAEDKKTDSSAAVPKHLQEQYKKIKEQSTKSNKPKASTEKKETEKKVEEDKAKPNSPSTKSDDKGNTKKEDKVPTGPKATGGNNEPAKGKETKGKEVDKKDSNSSEKNKSADNPKENSKKAPEKKTETEGKKVNTKREEMDPKDKVETHAERKKRERQELKDAKKAHKESERKKEEEKAGKTGDNSTSKETPKDTPKETPKDKSVEPSKKDDKAEKKVSLVILKKADGTFNAGVSGFDEVQIVGAKDIKEAQVNFEAGVKKYVEKVQIENEKAKASKEKGKKITMLPVWLREEGYEMEVLLIEE